MSDESDMRLEVPEGGMLMHANSWSERALIGQPDPRQLISAAAQIFDNAVEQWGKGLALAEALSVPTSDVSNWRKGKRRVPYYAVLALLPNDAAAESVLKAECGIAGYPAPVRNTIELSTPQALEIARMRDFLGDMWKFAGEEYAARFYRTTREHLDVAVDQHLRLGK